MFLPCTCIIHLYYLSINIAEGDEGKEENKEELSDSDNENEEELTKNLIKKVRSFYTKVQLFKTYIGL